MTEIKYNGSVVANFEGGNTATLPVKDKKMKSDIIITVPKAENGKPISLKANVRTAAISITDARATIVDDNTIKLEG